VTFVFRSRSSHSWRSSAVLLFVIAFACLFAASASAQDRILSYDVAIGVSPDSAMQVEERIHVRVAGDQIKHGILRDFPTQYQKDGGYIEVGFNVTKVELDGRNEPYTVQSYGNGRRVRIGRASTNVSPGEHTYLISYRTDHQLGFFDDHDELYWNATGTGWGFPIDRATVHVGLPDDIPQDKVRLEGYTGAQGAKGTAYRASMTNGIPTFTTTAPLRPHEGLTIVVMWPKGFVTQPAPLPIQHGRANRAGRPNISLTDLLDWHRMKLRDPAGMLMATSAIILFFLLIGSWIKVGRDPEGRSISVAYEPPNGLSPAATRYARLLRSDPKALTAAVLSMASKGYLTISEQQTSGLFSFSHVYVLTRSGKEPSLSQDEDLVAAALFSDDAKVAQARVQFEVQMQKLQAKHPQLAEMARSVASLATPQETNTVRLTPQNPRLQHASSDLEKSLKAAMPPSTLMKNHSGLIALAVLWLLGGAYASLRVYPGSLADNNWNVAPIAVFFMIWNMISVLNLVGSVSTFLPIDSFAPTPTFGKRVASAFGIVCWSIFSAATGFIVAMTTSAEWAAALMAMWALVAVFQRLLKSPTEAGQRQWDAIEGFRQFLAEVDEDRLNRMNPPSKTPELFERMLPYAVALECEVEWAKKFESVLAMAAAATSGGTGAYSPAWYSGPGMNAAAFADSFASSFSSAIASSATTPGSSSGGGGGGSSGGGGGGGGGGGW